MLSILLWPQNPGNYSDLLAGRTRLSCTVTLLELTQNCWSSRQSDELTFSAETPAPARRTTAQPPAGRANKFAGRLHCGLTGVTGAPLLTTQTDLIGLSLLYNRLSILRNLEKTAASIDATAADGADRQ